MKKIEIHCPWHGGQEEIEVPNGYAEFEGEVKCSNEASVGNNHGPFVLQIKLHPSGRVIELSRARN